MLQQKFKHSLTSNDVIIRTDAGADASTLTETAGKSYPLIRLNDTVFTESAIQAFSLSISIERLLPVLNVTVQDISSELQDKQLITKGSIITLVLGNAKDEQHELIKNDYYVISAEQGRGYTTLQAILYVPEMWQVRNRAFPNKPSIEVFEEIAKECNLGFVTNITSTSDAMNHIQYQPTYMFLQAMFERCYSSATQTLCMFIDQYANLCIIDIAKELTSNTVTTFKTDLRGQPLEQDVQFKFTNNALGNADEKDLYAQLQQYSNIQTDGLQSVQLPTRVNFTSYDQETLSTVEQTFETSQQLRDISAFTSLQNSNVHSHYHFARHLNTRLGILQIQRHKIAATTSDWYPQIFMMLAAQVDLYDAQKLASVNDQERSTTLDNMQDVHDANNKSYQMFELNPKSGMYICYGLTYTYTPEEEGYSRVVQQMQMLRCEELT